MANQAILIKNSPFFKKILFFLLVMCFIPSMGVWPNTEAVDWRFIPGGIIIGNLQINRQGEVFMLSEDKYLYSLSSKGRLIWRTYIDEKAEGPLTFGQDGFLYTALKNNRVIAVNSKGKIVWNSEINHDGPYHLYSNGRGTLFIFSLGGLVSVYNHTGKLLWTYNIGSALSCKPLLTSGGSFILVTKSGEIMFLSEYGNITSSRMLGHSCAFLGALNQDDVFACSEKGEITRLDLELKILWTTDLQNSISSFSISPSGYFAVAGSKDGTIYRIAVEDGGNQRFKIDTNGIVNISIDNKQQLIGLTESGTIFFTDLNTALKWKYQAASTPGAKPHTSLIFGNRVLVGFDDWTLYNIEIKPFQDVVQKPKANIEDVQNEEIVTAGYILLKDLIKSPDQTNQRRAITIINKKIDRSNLRGSYWYIQKFLKESILGNTSSNSSDLRSEAIDSLAACGDIETSTFLSDHLTKEDSTFLQLKIIQALEKLRSDISGRVVKNLHFYYSIMRATLNESYRSSLVSTIDSIFGFHGYLPSAVVVDLLVMILEDTESSEVVQTIKGLLFKIENN
jgi:outer membrane protein assembly factor BamB